MRILFCSQNPLLRTLGAPKVILELGDAFTAAGHECSYVTADQLQCGPVSRLPAQREFAARLAEHLRNVADQYDAVEYDHLYLPFPRNDFAAQTLMVARSVLLVHHLPTIRFPRAHSWRARLSNLLGQESRANDLDDLLAMATRTLAEADLVNVSNDRDKAELVRRGIDAGKIVVLPFGLSAARRAQFEADCSEIPPEDPVVTFVGTFDYRKGALDFPGIVQTICERVPTARFKLLGTAGLIRTARQVLGFFPRRLRGRIEVIPSFDPVELPELLADCSVGIFPSYYEGFGFGVLEMLAAAIPVIAYDAPGPPMMLPAEYLVPPGDVQAMSRKVIEWLSDRDKVAAARIHARELSRPFDWADIAQRTVEIYAAALKRRRESLR